jgi:gamma-glutamylcyclotransferase
MLYFAYGSNMFTKRLQIRVPSASKINNATLPGYSLFFHKRSNKDGSGKCNIKHQNDSVVYGVIFEIDGKQKTDLDRAEGLRYGYEEAQLKINTQNEMKNVFTYITTDDNIDNSLNPFSWYKMLVLEGAKEHGLPEEYIANIEAVNSDIDPDISRRNKELSIID